ncbi:MAG: hypothetical protein KGI70_02235 [Patescibacteria group bacterium]|nr:hypothetical protein [Patescibacteria group bacterium]
MTADELIYWVVMLGLVPLVFAGAVSRIAARVASSGASLVGLGFVPPAVFFVWLILLKAVPHTPIQTVMTGVIMVALFLIVVLLGGVSSQDEREETPVPVSKSKKVSI